MNSNRSLPYLARASHPTFQIIRLCLCSTTPISSNLILLPPGAYLSQLNTGFFNPSFPVGLDTLKRDPPAHPASPSFPKKTLSSPNCSRILADGLVQGDRWREILFGVDYILFHILQTCVHFSQPAENTFNMLAAKTPMSISALLNPPQKAEPDVLPPNLHLTLWYVSPPVLERHQRVVYGLTWICI